MSFMQILRDRSGHEIGRILANVKGRDVVLNRDGRIVGFYTKANDTTYWASGEAAGRGNMLAALLVMK